MSPDRRRNGMLSGLVAAAPQTLLVGLMVGLVVDLMSDIDDAKDYQMLHLMAEYSRQLQPPVQWERRLYVPTRTAVEDHHVQTTTLDQPNEAARDDDVNSLQVRTGPTVTD